MGLVIYPCWLMACRRQLVIPHFLQDKSFKRGSNVNLSSSVSAWHAITRLHFVLCIPLPPSFPIHARGIKISTVPYWTPWSTLLLSCSHGLDTGGRMEIHFHLHWYAIVLQMHYTRTNRIFSAWRCSHYVLLNSPHYFFSSSCLEQWAVYIIYPFFAVREWVLLSSWGVWACEWKLLDFP